MMSSSVTQPLQAALDTTDYDRHLSNNDSKVTRTSLTWNDKLTSLNAIRILSRITTAFSGCIALLQCITEVPHLEYKLYDGAVEQKYQRMTQIIRALAIFQINYCIGFLLIGCSISPIAYHFIIRHVMPPLRYPVNRVWLNWIYLGICIDSPMVMEHHPILYKLTVVSALVSSTVNSVMLIIDRGKDDIETRMQRRAREVDIELERINHEVDREIYKKAEEIVLKKETRLNCTLSPGGLSSVSLGTT